MNKVGIKTELNIYILLLSFLIILIQGIVYLYVARFDAELDQNIKRTFMNHLNLFIDNKLETLHRYQAGLIGNDDIKSILNAKNPSDVIRAYGNLSDEVYKIYENAVDVTHAIIIDANDQAFTLSQNISPDVQARIMSSYKSYAQGINFEVAVFDDFFDIDMETYHMCYFLCFAPLEYSGAIAPPVWM